MSSHYFITPFDPMIYHDDMPAQSPSDLAIDVDDFVAQLLEKWPDTKIFRNDSPMAVSWDVERGLISFDYEDEFPFYGSLNPDRQTISFRFLTPFIFWYRRYIPEKYPLYLFHDSTWASLQLTEATTINDIKKFFKYPE